MEPVTAIFILVVLLFSIIIHELSHGYIALTLGDPTAKYAGRLTLNPLKHLDPIGSVILPFILFVVGSPFLFGWAKPVPINPYNFKDQKWGSVKVSIAGPASNIVLALIFGLFLRFTPYELFVSFPGSLMIFQYVVLINLILAFFNLLPIPPLDGHWLLFHFLPAGFERMKIFLQQYGMFILVLLIFSGGLRWLFLAVQYFYFLITGVALY